PLTFLVVAFKDFHYDQGLWGSAWVGFQNFAFFFKSVTAFEITRNTILYNAAFIVITAVVGITLALMMNEVRSRWVKVHQTILFLPYFLSWVVVGVITQGFLENQHGLLNHLFATYGFDPVQW